MASENVSGSKTLELLLALKKALGSSRQIVIATVDNINQDDTFDCTPISGGAQFLGVQTKLDQESEEAFYIVPAKGSLVLLACGLSDDQQAVLLLASNPFKVVWRADKIMLDASLNGRIKVKAEEIEFNGGENGGLVVANYAANLLNEVIQAFNTHTHASSGAPPAIPIRTMSAGEMVNNKIKH